jgi:acetoacetyl-CoA reductase
MPRRNRASTASPRPWHRKAPAPAADVLDKIVAKIPVGRLGQASEIARGVAFLCSDEAGFVTGSTLSINGGQHMY